MPVFENIEGRKIFSIIGTLIRNNTLVKVSVPSHEYERLTLITAAQEGRKTPIFQIDPPKGLFQAIRQINSFKLNFEFTSDDQVTHRFDSQIQKLSESSIWLTYPRIIQRHQMRDNFRIKALQEAHVQVLIDDIELRMPIDNISMGGVYCYCRNLHKPLFEIEAKVKDLDLYFTHKEECFIVQIALAQIKRMESHVRTKHFGIAFEFLRLSNAVRRRLTQLIYELQREFLQQRLR